MLPSRGCLRVLLICLSISLNSYVIFFIVIFSLDYHFQTLCGRSLHVPCLLSGLDIHPETVSTATDDHSIGVSTSIIRINFHLINPLHLRGVIGQYPLSPIVGKVLDLYGYSTCSLMAAVCFSTSFTCSALVIARPPPGINYSSTSSFHRLTLSFLISGLGTVFSCVYHVLPREI